MKKLFFVIAVFCICIPCALSAGCIERHFEKTETVIVKFNSTGTVAWTTVIENTGYASSTSFSPSNQFLLTSDRGFIIAGFFYNSSGKKNIRLLKLDPAGNLLWEKRMPGDGTPLVVIQRPDGGFLLCNPYGRTLGFNVSATMESVGPLIRQADPGAAGEGASHPSDDAAGSDLIITGYQSGSALERFTITRLSSDGTVTGQRETGLKYLPVFDAGGPDIAAPFGEEVVVNLPVYINGSVIPPEIPAISGLPPWFSGRGVLSPDVIRRMGPDNTRGNPDIWLDSFLETGDGGIALLGSRYYYPAFF